MKNRIVRKDTGIWTGGICRWYGRDFEVINYMKPGKAAWPVGIYTEMIEYREESWSKN